MTSTQISQEIARLERRRRRTGFGDGRKRQAISHQIVQLRRQLVTQEGS